MNWIEQNASVNKKITIDAPASVVWQYLTTPELIKLWMLDPDMEMNISTNWQVGSPIQMKGKLHTIPFENNGTILTYEKDKVLEYTHLSSLSQLSDNPENFCTLKFILTPTRKATTLTLIITNFPTYSIFTHMDFYWRATMEVLKKQVEQNASMQIDIP
jgi:uncharacterized protein YndB with AHSA1/START domain